jgi:uncharacterized membrane-anchored protein
MKQLCILFTLLISVFSVFAQTDDSYDPEKIEQSLNYRYGEISIGGGIAKIKVPKGFKYLDPEQSEYVLTELWGNPKSGETMGMLVPVGKGIMDEDIWVFNIMFDEIGYVEDADAEDIDYAELLESMKADMTAENEERLATGYESIQLIDWASRPYYDKDQKILHWAKEYKFGEAETNVLNYNVRILGRKGVLVLNAIADIGSLSEVNRNIPLITSSIDFEQGQSYFDFNPDEDEVAAWTIGGLVAGKILSKVGFFALILKFWKVIAVVLLSIGGGVWKWITGKKEVQETVEEKEKVIN